MVSVSPVVLSGTVEDAYAVAEIRLRQSGTVISEEHDTVDGVRVTDMQFKSLGKTTRAARVVASENYVYTLEVNVAREPRLGPSFADAVDGFAVISPAG